MNNTVTIVGNLWHEPEIRYTASGVPVGSFTVSVNEVYQRHDGHDAENVHWHVVSSCQPLDAAIDVVSTWAAVLVILTLCGLATNSLMFFKMEVMLVWALVTPVAQWLVVVMGHHIVQRQMARPEARRKAVVGGAGGVG